MSSNLEPIFFRACLFLSYVKMHFFYVKSNILRKWSNILCKFYVTMFTPEHYLLRRSACSTPKPPAPLSSRLQRARVPQRRLAQWPSRPHPDPQAGTGRAHGQTARRGGGCAESAQTQARARVYTRESEHMRARTSTSALVLAGARSRTVSTIMDACDG